jgi:hypothetical protein
MELPAIEYHPFGTITFNFDDQPVNLRRCRLGDLEYAENLLQEIRDDTKTEREQVITDISALSIPEGETIPDAEIVERSQTLAQVMLRLQDMQRQLLATWLSGVLARMGDAPAPDPKDWPLDLYATYPITDEDGNPNPNAGQSVVISQVLDHWRTRPLVSSNSRRTHLAPVKSES